MLVDGRPVPGAHAFEAHAGTVEHRISLFHRATHPNRVSRDHITETPGCTPPPANLGSLSGTVYPNPVRLWLEACRLRIPHGAAVDYARMIESTAESLDSVGFASGEGQRIGIPDGSRYACQGKDPHICHQVTISFST